MKKLLMICLVFCMAQVISAKSNDDLAQEIQKQAESAFSAESMSSVIEVSFTVERIFSIYDIAEKNQNTVSLVYMVPGTEPEETNWDLDTVDKQNKLEVVLIEGAADLYWRTVINEAGRDKLGNYYRIIRNYNTEKKGCGMLLIDENWLIGSVECIGSEREGAVGLPNYILANTPYEIISKEIEGNLVFNMDNHLQVAPKGHIFKGPNFVLVYIGDTEIKNIMANNPVAGVMFFENNIFSLYQDGTVGKNFILRSNRYGIEHLRNRALAAGSYSKGRFKLDKKRFGLSATGGDMLFFEDPATGKHYLAGFSAGKINEPGYDTGEALVRDYGGEVSPFFYDLHKDDYNFLKKTVSSKSTADWNRIKSRILLK